MVTNTPEPFLDYFHKELAYLRNAGQVFAAKHPKLARRLGLQETEGADPHVERLLESFAFLTARLSQEIDDRLPQVASALLNVLYPHLLAPLPATAIAHFQADASKGTLTTGFDIAAHTPVFTYAEEGVACRFRTAYPVTLWPLEVEKADFIQGDQYALPASSTPQSWYLRLRLRSQGAPLQDLGLSKLVFHINADSFLSQQIYYLLFAQTHPQVLQSLDGATTQALPQGALEAVGFEEAESLVPTPAHSHPSYQLLQEYFHFPDKFMFFAVNGLKMDKAEQTFDILISISNPALINKLAINAQNFLLGCTPIVNLFPKVTDPFRLNHRQFEYPLIPDQRRERTTEIYSIQRVAAAIDEQPDSQTLTPYFSFNHDTAASTSSTYWVWRRISAEKRDLPGTDILLSFVDLKLNPHLPATHTIYAETLCTNRFLAEQIPAGAQIQLEERIPVSYVTCLKKPISQVYSSTDGESLWRLISQLSINHLSLSSGTTALASLKEALLLYGGNITQNPEIEALKSLETQPVVRRFHPDAWRGFVEGLAITLNVDESQATNTFLLASVLRHFYSLQVAYNSFVEVRLKSFQTQDEWMTWLPLNGAQILL